MSSRPEHLAPPEIFYSDGAAKKYTYNSRIIEIQEKMCERAIELLLLPEDKTCLLLDIGCGSGLSGNVIKSKGHHWIGIDISSSMLKVAIEREVEGDLIMADMGQGLPFKPSTFDGAISISALQWICNVDKSNQNFNRRLQALFTTLFASLSSNARAIFQFYPESDEQLNIITTAAARAGFFGGTIIDYPNSKKAKKFFLVLMTSGSVDLPNSININQNSSRKNKFKRKRQEKGESMKLKCKKTWILKKKEQYRRQGKKVKLDSKYTGRKRNSL